MKFKMLFPLSLILILSACSIFPGTSNNSNSSLGSSSNQMSENSEATSSQIGETSDTSIATSSQIGETSDTSIATSSKESKPLPTTTGICAFAPSEYDRVWAWTDSGNIFDVDWPGATTIKYDEEWNYYNFNDYQSLWIIFSIGGSNQSQNHQLTAPGYYWYKDGNWTSENPIPQEESSSEEEISYTSVSNPTPISDLDNTHRTWYQLLVYSFADGNGDGIGDFKGLVQHLDYLVNLGIGGIWLSPIHPSADYHGYDVKDYYSVDSKYEVDGYNFAKVLSECHKRDIRVLMDMVVNHTSDQHPWRSEHPDWYSGEHIFSGSMPDLDYDKQEVRTEIKKIGKYWLDKGVDGFRCDGAAWIYGGQGWTIRQETFTKTIEWWTEYAAYLKTIKSDIYLVGEVWTDLEYVEQFYSSKMNAFNFSASYWAKDAINDNDPVTWVEECVGHQSRVRRNNPNGVEASFLSNHDTGRFASEINSKDKLMLANALNVIAPGGSFVYYGDELGMSASADGYTDKSYRTPMPFSSGRTNSNNYMWSGSSSNTNSGKNADEDAASSTSMYSSLAKVIKFKNANPALYNAAVSKIKATSEIGVMKYDTGDEDYYLVLNSTGNSQSITVEGIFDTAFKFESNGAVTVSSTSISLPSYSFAILKASNSLSFSEQ